MLVIFTLVVDGMSGFMDVEFDGDLQSELSKLSAELRFLLGNSQIPLEVQAVIASLGLTDIDVFAKIADDVAGFRVFVVDDLHIATDATKKKVLTARLVGAWETACVRGVKRKADEADRRVGDLPRRLEKSAHLTLRKAFADVHKDEDEELLPAKKYVESKLDEIEDGELVAEPLQSVIAKSSSEGKKSQETKGHLPTNPEELRSTLAVMANCWEMVRLQLPDHHLLQGFKPSAFDPYVRWVLGKHVRGFEVKDDKGNTIYRPSWAAVLAFEHEVRKQAVKLCNENGTDLITAIKTAMGDTRLYQTFFLNPLSASAGAAAAAAAFSLSSSSSSRTSWHPPAPPPVQVVPSVGTVVDQQIAAQKVKGDVSQQICYAFQRKNCKKNDCARKHVCEICGDTEHGSKLCPHKGAGKQSGKGKAKGKKGKNS